MLQFQCFVDEVKTIKDGGLRIKLETQELRPEEKALVFGLNGLMWACFAETSVKESDLVIPELITGRDEKSPSQQLRSRMAAYYKETHKTFDGFPTWYAQALEEIGQKYLSKID